MFKGTTPSLILTFDEDVDFQDAYSIVVTFATDYHKIILEKSDSELEINSNTITINFTQEETLSFNDGTMLVQMNVLFRDGNRVASNIEEIQWVTNLKNEVMS